MKISVVSKMNLKSQKRIAQRILKCGLTRVRVEPSKEVGEALTREDIRELIKKGVIRTVQKKGSGRAGARIRLAQKKKGRMRGKGKRKGSKGARTSSKRVWIKKVRSIRTFLRKLRDSGQITTNVYRKQLLKTKGGAFRNKKHLLYYLKEHELLKKPEKKAKPKAVQKKTKAKPKTGGRKK